MTKQSAKPESDTTGDAPAVPDDFPRDPFPAALTGAQPKLAARKIDGRYVVGNSSANTVLDCVGNQVLMPSKRS